MKFSSELYLYSRREDFDLAARIEILEIRSLKL